MLVDIDVPLDALTVTGYVRRDGLNYIVEDVAGHIWLKGELVRVELPQKMLPHVQERLVVQFEADVECRDADRWDEDK